MANSNAYMRDYMLARYHRRKAKAIEQLGGKCVVCGSIKDLHFDHVDPAVKNWTIAKYLAGASEKRLQEELIKCQLLCFTHHVEKSRVDGGREKNNGPRTCACSRKFETRRQYAGHRAWCKVPLAESGLAPLS